MKKAVKRSILGILLVLSLVFYPVVILFSLVGFTIAIIAWAFDEPDCDLCFEVAINALLTPYRLIKSILE